MPDRAVVDERKVMCRECGGWFPANEARTYCVVRDGGDEYPATVLCEMCLGDVELDDDVERVVEETDEPQPRALVALSDDRKTLVVLEPDLDVPATSAFSIWGWEMRKGHVLLAVKVDTGQDAHAVLEQFLREANHA